MLGKIIVYELQDFFFYPAKIMTCMGVCFGRGGGGRDANFHDVVIAPLVSPFFSLLTYQVCH